MESDKVIAVTGATGLIGRALCHYLAGRGYEVRAMCRRQDSELAAATGIRLCSCDLPDQVDAAALRGCGAIIHAAYVTRATSRATAQRVNETGTRKLHQMSREAGVERFVFVSTTSAHERSRSYYGQSKFRLESSMDPDRDLVIRPGLVLSESAGLFARLTSTTGHGRPWFIPLFAGGGQPMQTIHIEDLCEGIRLALARRISGSLTLASPETPTVRQFFEAVASRANREPIFVPVPAFIGLAVLRLAEAVGLRLAVTSDNLLGLLGLKPWDSGPDLERIGLRVRNLKESLASLRWK